MREIGRILHGFSSSYVESRLFELPGTKWPEDSRDTKSIGYHFANKPACMHLHTRAPTAEALQNAASTFSRFFRPAMFHAGLLHGGAKPECMQVAG